MDDSYTKESAAALPLRQEIDRRMSAIMPERFITPTIQRDEKMHFACMATDEIKRLHTLCEMLVNERYAIEQKKREVGRDAKERFLSIGRDKSNEEIKNPGSPLFVSRELTKRLEDKLRRNDSLGRLVVMNLLLEIGSLHADLVNKQVFLCDDWSICWTNDGTDNVGVITRVLIRAVSEETSDAQGDVRRKKNLH